MSVSAGAARVRDKHTCRPLPLHSYNKQRVFTPFHRPRVLCTEAQPQRCERRRWMGMLADELRGTELHLGKQ